MSFHGYLRTDEPAGGDYVRYIEALVGGPPEDAERAAVELVQRLANRRPLSEPLDLTIVPAPASGHGRASGNTVGGTVVAGSTDADSAVPTTGAAMTPRPAPGLRQLVSRLMIIGGAVLVGLAFIAPEVVSIAPGAILLFAGFTIGRQVRQRAARGRPART